VSEHGALYTTYILHMELPKPDLIESSRLHDENDRDLKSTCTCLESTNALFQHDYLLACENGLTSFLHVLVCGKKL
jgi:hypothetical protein